MLAGTWRAGDREPFRSLDHARPGLIARRLPLFALGWLLTTGVWGLVLVLDSRLTVLPATFLFVFQLGVLITAIAICHHGARPARIPVVALAACILLSLSSTSVFAAIGGYGEMLAFILLTLFLASAPIFAWSGRAALVLLVGTLVPWLLAIPFLRFFTRPAELCAAIAIGSGVSLVVLEASKRNAKAAFKGAQAALARAEAALARAEATAQSIAAAQSIADAQSIAAARSIADAQSIAPPLPGGEIAMLRGPLLALKEEEVDGLRREVRRLRVEVNQHLTKDDPAEEVVRAGRPRRRRRRRPSESSETSS